MSRAKTKSDILILKDKYKWLNINTTVENYVEPKYYDRLLKAYIFNGKSDLVHLQQYLSTLSNPKEVLELGCGNGRATRPILKRFPKAMLSLVDLSPRMLKAARIRYEHSSNLRFIRSDAIQFLERTDKIYDLIVTLWSFSHSVHQLLSRRGLRRGRTEVSVALHKMVTENMKKGSKFFLIHFDSRSEEQRILIRQWRKVFPIFRRMDLQSPSKRYIDEALQTLVQSGTIRLSLRHYVGAPIIYNSIDEALEIFMNFHMESYFNQLPIVDQVINELTVYFRKYEGKDGCIRIRPGCYIYACTKLV